MEENFEQLLNNSEKHIEAGQTVTGKIISITRKNEIFVDLGYKADGIIPLREYSDRENADPNKEFKVGDMITVDILKMNDGLGNVLLSYKRAQKRTNKKEFWEKAEIGQKMKGIVRAISSYGAFVEVALGIEGLLHISDMTWKRNADPKDILKENDEIEVVIKELDKENKRVKLALVSKGENPWNKVESKYKVDDVVKVKIIKIMPFGAFAELEPGIEGLIHISQISKKRIANPREELQEGQEVNAKIIKIDLENKKIEFSMRELEGENHE